VRTPRIPIPNDLLKLAGECAAEQRVTVTQFVVAAVRVAVRRHRGFDR
jgi:hypothetical protein